MTRQHTTAPRSLSERRAAALAMLSTHYQLWLATGGDARGAHLIPVSFIWDDVHLTMATFARSRTTMNLRAKPRARAAVGRTDDVVMIDGDITLIDIADMDPDTADRYARVSHDPRVMPGFVYLRMIPARIQVWNGFPEYRGRTVMLHAKWLDAPID